jgi:hypothetical protein
MTRKCSHSTLQSFALFHLIFMSCATGIFLKLSNPFSIEIVTAHLDLSCTPRQWGIEYEQRRTLRFLG